MIRIKYKQEIKNIWIRINLKQKFKNILVFQGLKRVSLYQYNNHLKLIQGDIFKINFLKLL